MRNMLIKLKWIKVQMNHFIHYLVFIIIGGIFTGFIGIYRALISKTLIDAAISVKLNLLFHSLALLAASILVDIIIVSIISAMKARLSVRISSGIQRNLYERLMKTSWNELTKYHSGDILTRMTSDVDSITNLIVNIIPSFFSLIVLILGSFITLLFLNSYVAICIISISPITILIARLFSHKLKRIYIKSQEVESKYRSYVNESIQNMVIIKAFCNEFLNISRVKEMQREREYLVMERNKISIKSSILLQLGSWTGFFLVFLFGSFSISNGTSTFGTLTALFQLVGNIQGPFSALYSLLPQVVSAFASMERLMEVEKLSLDYNNIYNGDIKSAGVIYKNVNFSYKKGVQVLNNVSVKINAGETVAIIGPSGHGKTTFIYLMLALINPDSGHLYITYGSENIEITSNMRRFISYVPQGNTLFSGTIAENLRLGKPDATIEELEIATKASCAWGFIKDFPEGFNTVICEKGVGLSEGQAQRIAIARALLHNTPILLLDESTSALDSKTELEVLKSIQNLDPAPTCIIITHRTTALNICHRVFEIENTHLKEEDCSLKEIELINIDA